jgi:type I site-specific restriction endonuclease
MLAFRIADRRHSIFGQFEFEDFPHHPDLTARYARDTGIHVTQPEAAMLFQADSPAWSQSRYYQDAAIRAAFEKIIRCRQDGEAPRVLLALATGSGKTIIATNLLWRLSQAGQLPKPALFLCDRDELREQAYTKLKAAFGDNTRIVRTEQGKNAAQNARIHIATYQTLGLDDDEGFASFLTEHYGTNAFQRHHHRRMPPLSLGQVVGSLKTQPKCHPHRLDRHAAQAARSEERQRRRSGNHCQQPPLLWRSAL